MHLGEYIKKKRNEKGYTQEQLAERVGTTERNIRDIENKARTKISNTMFRILNELDISTDLIEKRNGILVRKEYEDLNPKVILDELDFNNLKEVGNEIEGSLRRASILIKEEKYEEVLNIYSSLSFLFNKEKLHLKVAILNQILNRHEKVIEVTDRILSMDLYKYEALRLKAMSLAEMGEYELSIKTLQEVLSIKKNYDIYNDLGVVYQRNGDIDNAIENYKQSIKLNNKEIEANLNISSCYLRRFAFDEALFYINEAIRLNPNDDRGYESRGEYYRFTGDDIEAISSFKQSLKRNNDNCKSLLGLALSTANIGEVAEATIYLKRLFELDYQEFINDEDKSSMIFIDIGLKEVNMVKVEKLSKDIVNIYIKDRCIPINMKEGKNSIFIGVSELRDDTGSLMYPLTGKLYENKEEFDEVVEQINKSIELFKCSDGPIYVNFEDEIKVEVKERKEDVLIEISFGNRYRIIGVTDTKGEGYYKFIEQYKKFNQFRIHIECKGDLMIIECVKNITFL